MAGKNDIHGARRIDPLERGAASRHRCRASAEPRQSNGRTNRPPPDARPGRPRDGQPPELEPGRRARHTLHTDPEQRRSGRGRCGSGKHTHTGQHTFSTDTHGPRPPSPRDQSATCRPRPAPRRCPARIGPYECASRTTDTLGHSAPLPGIDATTRPAGRSVPRPGANARTATLGASEPQPSRRRHPAAGLVAAAHQRTCGDPRQWPHHKTSRARHGQPGPSYARSRPSLPATTPGPRRKPHPRPGIEPARASRPTTTHAPTHRRPAVDTTAQHATERPRHATTCRTPTASHAAPHTSLRRTQRPHDATERPRYTTTRGTPTASGATGRNRNATRPYAQSRFSTDDTDSPRAPEHSRRHTTTCRNATSPRATERNRHTTGTPAPAARPLPPAASGSASRPLVTTADAAARRPTPRPRRPTATPVEPHLVQRPQHGPAPPGDPVASGSSDRPPHAESSCPQSTDPSDVPAGESRAPRIPRRAESRSRSTSRASATGSSHGNTAARNHQSPPETASGRRPFAGNGSCTRLGRSASGLAARSSCEAARCGALAARAWVGVAAQAGNHFAPGTPSAGARYSSYAGAQPGRAGSQAPPRRAESGSDGPSATARHPQ